MGQLFMNWADWRIVPAPRLAVTLKWKTIIWQELLQHGLHTRCLENFTTKIQNTEQKTVSLSLKVSHEFYGIWRSEESFIKSFIFVIPISCTTGKPCAIFENYLLLWLFKHSIMGLLFFCPFQFLRKVQKDLCFDSFKEWNALFTILESLCSEFSDCPHLPSQHSVMEWGEREEDK